MRKILAFLVTIAAAFTLVGCEAAEKTTLNPPFFAVYDENTGGTVYMLGSMHAGLDGTEYPEEIYDALIECGRLVCEVDTVALAENRDEAAEAVAILECGSAAEFMGEDYDEIRSYFIKMGLYNTNYDKYIPAMWSIMLSQKLSQDSGLNSDFGTEAVLLTYAKAHDIEIIELETAAEQYSVNAGQSAALQIYSLKESINTPYDELLAQITELYSAWSAGDGKAIEEMLTEEIPEELADDYSEFYEAMYTDRQKKMADFVTDTLESGGKAFLMVGAAHFYAYPDILDYIEQAGYKAEAVNT